MPKIKWDDAEEPIFAIIIIIQRINHNLLINTDSHLLLYASSYYLQRNAHLYSTKCTYNLNSNPPFNKHLFSDQNDIKITMCIGVHQI